MSDDAVPLGDGRYEEKVPVDRKKLEAMITGRPSPDDQSPLPTAENFFEQVICYSGARVFWPSQLKIGAKTKRDPFVKVQGTLDQIERAKGYIASLLQAKKERVTLKMEIHHSIHAHIIGKGGKSIQQIMRTARCHIHFPDSNKFSEPNTKSDQVSVTGAPQLVDNARRILRFISPVLLSMEVPLVTKSAPHPPPAFKENISWQQMSASTYMVFIRENSGEIDNIRRMVQIATAQFSLPPSYPLVMTTSLNLKEEILQLIKSEENRGILTSQRDAQVSIHESLAVICGKLEDVIKMRTILIGYSTISLSFDIGVGQAFSSFSEIQKKFKLTCTTKKKANQPNTLTIALKSTENRITDLLEARDYVLGITGQDYPANEYTNLTRKGESPSRFPPSLELPSFAMLTPSETPKSPDPEDSPLAASILKGIKDMEKQSGSWSKKPLGREDLLKKAAHAVFDDSPSTPGMPRYPTDQWAGYGFSSSLPAELLKGLLDVSSSNHESELINRRRESKTPPTRGLYSLREEDELSDFSGSFSSIAGQSRNFDRAPRRLQPFSASTSIFDASPVSSEFSWDIRSCADPAMVLAQLGCSEYLPQMREQEIDMHAFLLLDEQNLKDIGVSTIGARKKIHHAIIKLRESARRNGFAL